MSANIYHPSRGGVRGGRDQFNWEDVKEDKDRENYLGNDQTGMFVFCSRKIFFLSNLFAWNNPLQHLCICNSIIFKDFFIFCALDLLLHALQFACSRKIFSAHYILSCLW